MTTTQLTIVLILSSLIALTLLGFLIWRISRGKKNKTFYPSGELRTESFLKKTKKNGKEKVYYKTGELNKTKRWKKGILDGECVTYLKDGSIYISEIYNNGELEQYKVFDILTKEVIYELD